MIITMYTYSSETRVIKNKEKKKKEVSKSWKRYKRFKSLIIKQKTMLLSKIYNSKEKEGEERREAEYRGMK